MKIAVCIKQVPDVKGVRMDEETGTIVRSASASVTNPLDLYAVELALRIREERQDVGITVFTMGPQAAEAALREALALGVDEAVLISDRKFGGSDTWATANVLAHALKKNGNFDLVICGERAIDGDTGQVGPELAAALDYEVATYVHDFTLLPDGGCRFRRRVEEGVEFYHAALPLVISVGKEVGFVRLPTFRGVLNAETRNITHLSHAELEIPDSELGLAGSPTRVVKIFSPKVSRCCRMFPVVNDESLKLAAVEFRQWIDGGNL